MSMSAGVVFILDKNRRRPEIYFTLILTLADDAFSRMNLADLFCLAAEQDAISGIAGLWIAVTLIFPVSALMYGATRWTS